MRKIENKIITGDSRKILKTIAANSVDVVYLDPPFFTQKKHALKDYENEKEYSFSDKWNSIEEYLLMIATVLKECKRVLKDTGSIFLHCDKTASHYLRIKLDEIFGMENFRNEIIWSYKRWSNSKKGLLNSHQNIYFYSKSEAFKFNTIYTDYSPTTNLDQILQERIRDKNGKSKYKVDDNGKVITAKEKKGVPLSDVWEIPFLNPKANERSGYPTQKPILLINQILNISSNEGDVILDPFCGSGTTCVSAKLLNRKFIGIDCLPEATKLSTQRLNEMIVTDSALLRKGKANYIEQTDDKIALLNMIGAFPVQRNAGIDGFLKSNYQDKPVPVRIQDKNESLDTTIEKFKKATRAHSYKLKIVIQIKISENNPLTDTDIIILKSNLLQISELLDRKDLLKTINNQPEKKDLEQMNVLVTSSKKQKTA